MRIVLIGPAPPLRGGIAAHTAGLARALDASGHCCSVLSYARLYPDSLFPGRSPWAAGGETVGEAILDSLSPASWRRAARWIRRVRPDAVVVEWWHPIVAPALRTALSGAGGAPVIFVCHNARPHEPTPAAGLLSRLALSRADAFLCHSQYVADRLESGSGRSRPIEVAPMPLLVDVGETLPSRAAGRACFGIEAGARLAVSVGHVRRYKGVDILLDAWSCAALPDGAALLIAGEIYGRGLRRLIGGAAARRPGVHVVDRYLADDELVAVAAAADVVVLPYVHASQSGLVPLARALGVALIATDAGGLPAQLADASAQEMNPADAMVAAGDRASLAHALERILVGGADVATRQDWGDGGRRAGSTGLGTASWQPTTCALEQLARAARPVRGAPVAETLNYRAP